MGAVIMNAHFAAAVPNLRIMEIDIDRLPWDEEVFTRRAAIRQRPALGAHDTWLGRRA
jgi:hypothetical protein